jgi:hypothetical protein
VADHRRAGRAGFNSVEGSLRGRRAGVKTGPYHPKPVCFPIRWTPVAHDTQTIIAEARAHQYAAGASHRPATADVAGIGGWRRS